MILFSPLVSSWELLSYRFSQLYSILHNEGNHFPVFDGRRGKLNDLLES